MGLAVLSGKMTAISLHLRQVASPGHPISKGAVSPVVEAGERCATLQPLEAMAVPRCAFGVCVWNDSFVVCGAYLWISPSPTSHPCVGREGWDLCVHWSIYVEQVTSLTESAYGFLRCLKVHVAFKN